MRKSQSFRRRWWLSFRLPVERSTYSIALHMVHLLLYDLPSASRTGSRSRVQLSFPFCILSRYSAHWSWKRKVSLWITWTSVLLLSLTNLTQNHLSKRSSDIPPFIYNILPLLSTEKGDWNYPYSKMSVVMDNNIAFKVLHREIIKLAVN